MNYKKKSDPENFCQEWLLLYTAWRHEENDLYHGKTSYIDAFESQKHIIEAKMKIYEPMSRILETITDEIDEDTVNMKDVVAPATQHEESQHKLQCAILSNAFAFFDPDRPEIQRHYDIGPQLDISTSCYDDIVQIVADKMPDSEY